MRSLSLILAFTKRYLVADSLFFKKITNYIIPGIAHLMKTEPLIMSRLAPEAFRVQGGNLDFDCTDIRDSDQFFENFALM